MCVLGYGNLLGLVRNGKQIPHDPDYDILIKRECMDAIKQRLTLRLPQTYYLNTEFENDRPNSLGKLKLFQV